MKNRILYITYIVECTLLDQQTIYLGFGDFTALDVLMGGVGGPPGLRLDLGTAPLLQVSAFL